MTKITLFLFAMMAGQPLPTTRNDMASLEACIASGKAYQSEGVAFAESHGITVYQIGFACVTTHEEPV